MKYEGRSTIAEVRVSVRPCLQHCDQEVEVRVMSTSFRANVFTALSKQVDTGQSAV